MSSSSCESNSTHLYSCGHADTQHSRVINRTNLINNIKENCYHSINNDICSLSLSLSHTHTHTHPHTHCTGTQAPHVSIHSSLSLSLSLSLSFSLPLSLSLP